MSLNLTATVGISEIQGDTERLGSAVLSVLLVDDRPYIANKYVEFTVDWGDGSVLYSSAKALSPVGPTVLDHTYRAGSYTITISARNYRSPQPDEVAKSLPVFVTGDVSSTLIVQPVIFGPILPRDVGSPNKLDWEFNSSQDNLLLASSAKMLLSTVIGERLMNPSYGTGVSALIFDPQDATSEGALYQELVRSFTENEPRLAVVKTEFYRESKRIVVNTILQSQLDKRTIALTSTFQTT
jgi:phage baseplate assembly protein W